MTIIKWWGPECGGSEGRQFNEWDSIESWEREQRRKENIRKYLSVTAAAVRWSVQQQLSSANQSAWAKNSLCLAIRQTNDSKKESGSLAACDNQFSSWCTARNSNEMTETLSVTSQHTRTSNIKYKLKGRKGAFQQHNDHFLIAINLYLFTVKHLSMSKRQRKKVGFLAAEFISLQLISYRQVHLDQKTHISNEFQLHC